MDVVDGAIGERRAHYVQGVLQGAHLQLGGGLGYQQIAGPRLGHKGQGVAALLGGGSLCGRQILEGYQLAIPVLLRQLGLQPG